MDAQAGKKDDFSTKKKILLVDDDDFLLTSLGEIFESNGFQCFTAKTVRDASLKLRQVQFDLLVLDFQLGGETSASLVEDMQQKNGNMSFGAKIVVLSGTIDQSHLKSIIPYISGALIKPVMPAVLLNKVNQVLKIK